MNYLNKVKIKRYLPFFLGFFLSFCLINYKVFILDLILDKNYEILDYIRPAKTTGKKIYSRFFFKKNIQIINN